MRGLLLITLGSIAGMIGVGYLFLFFNPPTEAEKTCVGRPPAQVRQCLIEHAQPLGLP